MSGKKRTKVELMGRGYKYFDIRFLGLRGTVERGGTSGDKNTIDYRVGIKKNSG